MNVLIQCPNCRARLLEEIFNQPDLSPCPACGVPLQVETFPALFRKTAPGPSAEAVLVEGESSCFYHAQKKAVRPCDGCGRFLCALCDCEFHGRHYCPACLEAGQAKGKIENLENKRMRYDRLALGLALYPLLLFYFTIITAPMALFVAIRYWNSPPSLVGKSKKVSFVLAIILSLLQIAGWVTVLVFLTALHHS